jgi:predicted dehydrogenase
LDGDLSGVAGNISTGAEARRSVDAIPLKTTDPEELIWSDVVDVVDICTPTVTHKSLVCEALERSKHVICEKPLARTYEDVIAIAEGLGRSDGVFFMPAFCMRFWPEWARMRDAVVSQRFGKVLGATFRRLAEPPGWGRFLVGEESGGALFDLHIHDSDFVRYCFGMPRSVRSVGFSKVSGAVDHLLTQYEVEGGAAVTAEGGWAMEKGFGFRMEACIQFEEATLDFQIARADAPLMLYRAGAEPEAVQCPGPDGYVRELQHFAECWHAGQQPTVATLDDALDAFAICRAEEESVMRRVPVSVEPVFSRR